MRYLKHFVCSNGWDDVTAALPLLSHRDGDVLNIALTAGSGVPAGRAGVSDQLFVGPLQLTRTPGGVQASILAGSPTARR